MEGPVDPLHHGEQHNTNDTCGAYKYIGNRQTWLAKTRMSSLNDSDEQTSPPAIPGSRGVHVANSHFSNINASNGNSG